MSEIDQPVPIVQPSTDADGEYPETGVDDAEYVEPEGGQDPDGQVRPERNKHED